MKRNALIAALTVMATSLGAAPKDDVDAAIKKLAGSENYQWKTTVDAGGGFGSGTTSGKTSKDGLIMVSRTMGDNTTEGVLKGEKGAVKTDDGWQSFDELQAAGGGGRGRGGRGFFIRNTRTPAAEAADILGKLKEVKGADGTYSGDLTAEGAGSLMTLGFGRGRGARGGGGTPPPAPSNAKGSAKFWIKDGVLAKYEFHVEGAIAGPNGDFDIDRKTTVEISGLGSTKVEVPADAQKKLE